MNKNTSKQFAIAERRRQVSELRLQGWSQQSIAERLKVGQKTVSRDLDSVRRQWEKSNLDDFAHVRGEELQKLGLLEREAWAAWERSQKPAQSAAVTEGDAKKATRKTVKNQLGDPRFLQVVQRCIELRCDILGIDAPRKVAPTNVEGRTITLTDLLGRIRSAAPAAPGVPAIVERSNVFDVKAELARRAPPPVEG